MIKDIKDIIKVMKADGWVVVSMKNHVKMRHPSYGTQTLPQSPKDFHWKKNLIKQINSRYPDKKPLIL